jgi:hypothetical protein
MINDVFFVRLGNTRAVNLVNRNIVERVLREHSFQANDWSNENKTAELAKALNANWMVQGNIRKSGNFLLIIVQFYDIRTFEFKGGTDIRLANADEAYEKIDPLVSNLIETISGSGGRTGVTPPRTGGTYNVGDTGPAGGIIFYDRGFVADGWRYLEAAPAGSDFRAEWGAYTGSGRNTQGRDIPGTSTVVGSGKRNTELIVARLQQWGENYRAAQICVGMDINGYKDWFLPSKDELNLMYQNLHRRGLGGFSGYNYWSSSQASIHFAWAQDFSSGSDGGSGSIKEATSIAVRAVRAF